MPRSPFLLSLCLAAAPLVMAQAPAASAPLPVDRGWLGVEGPLEFRSVPGFEWMVVVPGAAPGTSIRIGPWRVGTLPPKCSTEEITLAHRFGPAFEHHLKETFKNARFRAGDVLWSGRIVDVSKAEARVMVDLKATDPATGRLLYAFRRALPSNDKDQFDPPDFDDAFKSLNKLYRQGLTARYDSGTKVEVPLVGAVSAATPPPARPTGPLLADGLLDPSWFHPETTLPFRTSKEIDFLWVKPGFELRGKSLRIEPWDMIPLPAERDDKDESLARELVAEMPELIQKIFGEDLSREVKTSMTEGEFRILGRWVDQIDGNAYVPTREVFDLKILDAKGDVVVAVHHACGFGASSSALRRWLRNFSFVVKSGLSPFYEGLAPLPSH